MNFEKNSLFLYFYIKMIHFMYLLNKKKINKFEDIIRGTLNKFPDFFRMGTFIDNTHIKL